MDIITNNHAREIFYDYPDDAVGCYNVEEFETAEYEYVIYKGERYYLNNFLRNDGMFPEEWDGYISHTIFSGIVIRYSDFQGYSPAHPHPQFNYHLSYASTHDSNTYGDYAVVGYYTT